MAPRRMRLSLSLSLSLERLHLLGLGLGLGLAAALPCMAQASDPPRVTLIRVDASRAHLRLFLRDAAGRPYRSFDRLDEDLRAHGHRLVAALNAGMYQSDLSPVGLLVVDGRTLHPLDTTTGRGNFYLQPNGVFVVTASGARIVRTDDYASAPPADVVQATQSGPLLLVHGALAPAVAASPHDPAKATRYTRNGVCVDGDAVTLAIADTPMTLREFALYLRDHAGCRAALYLDGAISKLFDRRTGRDDRDGDMGPILAIVD